MKKELVYRVGTAETAKQQAELFNLVFNMNATEKSWLRKHVENPLSGKCTVMCAFDGDKIVGINGFLPMEYELDGKIYRVLQSCDTAVSPEYRGQGIFSKIISAAKDLYKAEGYDAFVGFPNKNSYHGFIKQGWIEQHRTMKYFFPNNVKNVARDMLEKNVPSCFDFLAGMWRGLHSFPYSLACKKKYSIFEKKDITPAEYSKFLPEGKFRIRLSDEYLAWKLSSNHCLYTVEREGKIACRMLVCDYYVDEQYRRGNILAVDGGELGTKAFRIGMSMLLAKIHKQYDILSVWESPDENITKSFRRLGFIANFSEKTGSPFIVRILTDDEEKIKKLTDPSLWEPSFIEADYVMDHNV